MRNNSQRLGKWQVTIHAPLYLMTSIAIFLSGRAIPGTYEQITFPQLALKGLFQIAFLFFLVLFIRELRPKKRPCHKDEL